MSNPRRIQLVGQTDVGMVRKGNEDCYIIQPMGLPRISLDPSDLFELQNEHDLFLAVSDGMGGAAAGEVASQTALETLNEFLMQRYEKLREASPEETVAILEEGIHTANEAILEKAREIKSHKGMGATITAAYVKADIMYLLQVGDSRAYVLRGGKLVRVTRDQSFVGHLVEMGTITEEQAQKHPQRNVILQALGSNKKLNVDVSYLPLCQGDLVLLCSDGLYGEFMPKDLDQQIHEASSLDLRECVRQLVEEALKAGGKDNVTVIGLRIASGAPKRGPGEEPRYKPFPNLDRDNPLDKSQSLFS